MKRRMIRLQIVGLHEDLAPVLLALQKLACVEIIPAVEGKGVLATDTRAVQEEEEVTYLLTRLDSLLALLLPAESRNSELPDADLATIRGHLDQLTALTRGLADRRDALLNEQNALPRYQSTLRKLVPLIPETARHVDTASTVVLVSEAHRWVLRDLADRVRELTGSGHYIVEESIGDGLRAMLIVVPASLTSALQTLLGQKEIAQMQLPEGYANRPPDQTVMALERRLTAIPAEITAIEAELAGLGRHWAERLWGWRRQLIAWQGRLQARERVGTTTRAFILEGWCPVDAVTAVVEALRPFSTVHISQMPPRAGDEVPVALANPRPVRPFESLVRLLAHPRYDGIDPTWLMALFLPLFFGMILGDIGYAAVIFAAASIALLRVRRAGMMRDVLHILQLGSLWGAIFGLLYGEAFGTLGGSLGLHPLWLERAAPEYLTSLLLFTVALGVGHVTLGLLLGVWMSWQSRDRRHLLERGGMLVAVVGLMVLAGALTRQIPDVLARPGTALLVVGIVLLSASHGWLGILLGPIEFVGLLGNMLSYLRIAAVGLASVYVALVANELAGNLGSLIVGLVAAVLIHALNIVLGAFSPTIHSLRLHYVEFFRKFYEGGGRPFQPFGETRG